MKSFRKRYKRDVTRGWLQYRRWFLVEAERNDAFRRDALTFIARRMDRYRSVSLRANHPKGR